MQDPDVGEATTFVTTFDVDLLDPLCVALGPEGVLLLESTCNAMRTVLDAYWHRKLHACGFDQELRIPDQGTRFVRQVVVRETRRRATFGMRLMAALWNLGLSCKGGTSVHDVEAGYTETQLRLLQFRHGFLLDRRYSRALRQERIDLARDLPFYADSLPGSAEPSADTAASRYAASGGASRRTYPQRAAFLSLATYQTTQASLDQRVISRSGRRTRPLKLADALITEGLDPLSRPRIDELNDGRDLELCAFAPVLNEARWTSGVFSPPTTPAAAADIETILAAAGLVEEDVIEPANFFEAGGARLVNAPAGMHYPIAARFDWQLSAAATARGAKYHRMGVYTVPMPISNPDDLLASVS